MPVCQPFDRAGLHWKDLSVSLRLFPLLQSALPVSPLRSVPFQCSLRILRPPFRTVSALSSAVAFLSTTGFYRNPFALVRFLLSVSLRFSTFPAPACGCASLCPSPPLILCGRFCPAGLRVASLWSLDYFGLPSVDCKQFPRSFASLVASLHFVTLRYTSLRSRPQPPCTCRFTAPSLSTSFRSFPPSFRRLS